MKRLLTTLAAMAASAAVAAAITLPAGADPASRPNDEGAQINACLRAHGAAVPADLLGRALKEWVGDHQSDPAVDACMPGPGVKPAPEELIACLRDHGLNPPSQIEGLKPYLAQHENDDALQACGVGSSTPAKPGDCGADKPQTEAAKRH
jgi:hypothetical protein